MRKIPTKNYFILIGLVIATVIITISLSNFYNNRHRKTSILYDYLPEVTVDDLDLYLTENNNAIIFISDKYNLDDKKFEKEFKKKIIDLNLSDYCIYLDINKIDDKFKEEFNKKYDGELTNKYPNIVIIEDKKVVGSYTDKFIDDIDFEVIK